MPKPVENGLAHSLRSRTQSIAVDNRQRRAAPTPPTMRTAPSRSPREVVKLALTASLRAFLGLFNIFIKYGFGFF